MLTNPGLLMLTLTYAAVGYYEYTLFYWMKYYFSDVLRYPEQTSRYFTSVVTLSMVVAMPLGGILSDWLVRAWGYRVGRSAVPLFGMLASAVLLFVATRVQGQVPVVLIQGITLTSGVVDFWPAGDPTNVKVLNASASGGPQVPAA